MRRMRRRGARQGIQTKGGSLRPSALALMRPRPGLGPCDPLRAEHAARRLRLGRVDAAGVASSSSGRRRGKRTARHTASGHRVQPDLDFVTRPLTILYIHWPALTCRVEYQTQESTVITLRSKSGSGSSSCIMTKGTQDVRLDSCSCVRRGRFGYATRPPRPKN
jgi:hypothetical protein